MKRIQSIIFYGCRQAMATLTKLVPAGGAFSPSCVPGKVEGNHPWESKNGALSLDWGQRSFFPPHLFLCNRWESLWISRKAEPDLSAPSSHVSGTFRLASSLLIKTQASTIFLLTGPHKKKHQSSVTPTVFWITRVLLIKEEVFSKRHPFPTDFPKNIVFSSKITASCPAC